MNALATLETGLLLGLYALLAGIWGVLFALAQLREMSIFRQSAAVAYGLHAVAAVAIVDAALARLEGPDRRQQPRLSRTTTDDLAVPPAHPSRRSFAR